MKYHFDYIPDDEEPGILKRIWLKIVKFCDAYEEYYKECQRQKRHVRNHHDDVV